MTAGLVCIIHQTPTSHLLWNVPPAYVHAYMSGPGCATCGAELMSGAVFCRQCGAPVVQPAERSEQPTELLNQGRDASTTQRLDPRPTSPGYHNAARSGSPPPIGSAALPLDKLRSRVRGPVLVGIVILALLAIGSVVAVMRSGLKARYHGQQRAELTKSLFYPGAQTVLDVTHDDSSGVLQLQTPDHLDKVQAWYESALKPTKILRVTSTTVILKNGPVTATLVAEDNTTTIVIKQSPR